MTEIYDISTGDRVKGTFFLTPPKDLTRFEIFDAEGFVVGELESISQEQALRDYLFLEYGETIVKIVDDLLGA